MYSKADTSKLKQEFWTAFGRYMSPLPNSEGFKINWINYHTGFKHVYFRMEAEQTQAEIYMALTQPDETMRQLLFEELKKFRLIFQEALQEEWIWEPETQDEQGRKFAKISTRIQHVNVFQREDWPAIISFLKPRIMGLDQFWNEVKDALDDFR